MIGKIRINVPYKLTDEYLCFPHGSLCKLVCSAVSCCPGKCRNHESMGERVSYLKNLIQARACDVRGHTQSLTGHYRENIEASKSKNKITTVLRVWSIELVYRPAYFGFD